jgi:hypothetical protein
MRTGLFKGMAVILLVGVMLAGSLQGQVTGIPPTGKVGPDVLYQSNIGPILQAQVTVNISGQTQFGSSWLTGYGNDFFNTTWLVRVVTATNITAGTVVDITDYVSSTGTFTTASAGASWAIGDRVEVCKDWVIDGSRESGAVDGAMFIGTIDTYTSTTVFTVTEFLGIDAVLYSVQAGGQPRFVIRVDQVDEDADSSLVGQWRALMTITAAGVCTVAPAFVGEDAAAVLDAGDYVSIVPMNYINPPASMRWHEYATTGGSGTVTLTGLIGKDASFIPVGAHITCLNDQSASTNDGKVGLVASFTSATGAVTFTPVHTAAVGDHYLIEYNMPDPLPTTIQTTIAAAGLDAASNGTAITGAAAGGSVYINTVSIQIITANESAAVTSLTLRSVETGANDLAMPLYDTQGALLTASDFALGCVYTFRVDHVLPVAGILYLDPSIDSAGAGYVVSVSYTAPFGASIAGL